MPASQILTESSSRNTHDQAVLIAPLLQSLRAEQVVLVTSPVHMRRSLGAFRAVGVDAIAAIAQPPPIDLAWPMWVVPTGIGLTAGAMVAHEVLGLPYYALRGWYR